MFAEPTRAHVEETRPVGERVPVARLTVSALASGRVVYRHRDDGRHEERGHEPDILDLVDHAMGANPDPPEAFAGAKLLSSVRTRVLRE
jgi:hypothetical protein